MIIRLAPQSAFEFTGIRSHGNFESTFRALAYIAPSGFVMYIPLLGVTALGAYTGILLHKSLTRAHSLSKHKGSLTILLTIGLPWIAYLLYRALFEIARAHNQEEMRSDAYSFLLIKIHRAAHYPRNE